VDELYALPIADMLPFIAAGFVAQLVDGALGMAFGVISSTLLLSLGVPPTVTSAGVHTVETFTTAAAGISHVAHKNVDWRLFVRLVIPGVIGGVVGAYALSETPAEIARPLILVYLTVIGLYLLWRGIMYPPKEKQPGIVAPLGFVGGFLDAAGGGGWGPIVTSNLLIQGSSPRKTVGTVVTAEFFLTVAISATFIVALGVAAWTLATLGLLIGGIFAAPLGARIAAVVPAKRLLILIGTVLTVTSAVSAWNALL
jgi:uncharacterized membrane protein YfcA